MLKSVAVAAVMLPTLACADACPWLGEDAAAGVILANPVEVKLEKHPVFANKQGLVASTTCLFRDANELVGSLSVVVMEFASYEAATAAYRKELGNRAARAEPAKIGENPAFFTHSPGLSAASCAVKDKRLVFVSHAFGKRVKEALRQEPQGAVVPTHEVARQVLGSL